jgi:RNA polymerase sigma-70 factor (ECF subfamily)
MGDSPATRASLLVRIRDARDALAWSQFVELYAPLVYGFVRRHGLQDADAADLTQEVLRSVSVAIRRFDYDPQRGSFRGWLFTVVSNHLSTFLGRQQRQCRGSGDSAVQGLLEGQPAPGEDAEAAWRQDYQRRLLAWAAREVRGTVEDRTWQAFWHTNVEGQSASDAARELGMTVAAVYMARSRVLARLKEQVRQAQGTLPWLEETPDA